MNNACPSCGAVYAVTARDVGRKIKCKKCSSALRVDDSGLVEDAPAAPPPEVEEDEEEGTPRKKSKRGGGMAAPDFGALLDKVGGVPAALFGFGLFLTIWFFFQSVISAPGGASDGRAQAAYTRVQLEQKQELRKVKEDEPERPEPPGPGADDAAQKAFTAAIQEYDKAKAAWDKDVSKKTKEINKKYRKPLNEAGDDYASTQISNARGVWWDQYGLMFGFLFLSFGCIAYVRSDGNLILRIVAGTILTVLMMAIFAKFSGCRGVG